jgi:hypothetical protein
VPSLLVIVCISWTFWYCSLLNSVIFFKFQINWFFRLLICLPMLSRLLYFFSRKIPIYTWRQKVAINHIKVFSSNTLTTLFHFHFCFFSHFLPLWPFTTNKFWTRRTSAYSFVGDPLSAELCRNFKLFCACNENSNPVAVCTFSTDCNKIPFLMQWKPVQWL